MNRRESKGGRVDMSTLGLSVDMRNSTSRSSIYIPRERESDVLTISEIFTTQGWTCPPVPPYLGQTPLLRGGSTPPSEVPRNDDTNQRKGPNR